MTRVGCRAVEASEHRGSETIYRHREALSVTRLCHGHASAYGTGPGALIETDWTAYRRCATCLSPLGRPCMALSGSVVDGQPDRVLTALDRPHLRRRPRTGGLSASFGEFPAPPPVLALAAE